MAKINQQASMSVQQSQHTFCLTKLNAGEIVKISYAATRGRDSEEGAVQRLLNPRRISSLKGYALSGGDYPSCIVLNWVNIKNPLKYSRSKTQVTVPSISHSAQIIDGQHRVAGLREAIKEKKDVAKVEIPVALYEGLTTQQCADIFISINTEQRPAPKSLVYDLYGEASEHIADQAAVRATDIATALNSEDDSPYLELIKFPSGSRAAGGIALSTVVSSLKPLVENLGIFEQVGISELEYQKRVVINYFSALKSFYGDRWLEKDNVFLYAAGFTGAVNFLKNRLINFCHLKRSYEISTIQNAFSFNTASLLWRSDLKGLQGRESYNRVFENLAENFDPGTTSGKNLKF